MRLFFWDSFRLFVAFRGGEFAPPERRVKSLILKLFFLELFRINEI